MNLRLSMMLYMFLRLNVLIVCMWLVKIIIEVYTGHLIAVWWLVIIKLRHSRHRTVCCHWMAWMASHTRVCQGMISQTTRVCHWMAGMTSYVRVCQRMSSQTIRVCHWMAGMASHVRVCHGRISQTTRVCHWWRSRCWSWWLDFRCGSRDVRITKIRPHLGSTRVTKGASATSRFTTGCYGISGYGGIRLQT